MPQYDRVSEEVQSLASGGTEHAEVLVEMNRLQNKQAGWGNAILLFVLSLLAFMGVGWKQWSWKVVLMLVPLLLFHELGHYVAMRGFNYRNLRMFFIPFFGAAVSGRHYNVPGWKKVIVSMMGPVPGIFLGVVIGGAGLMLHQPGLVKLAIFALILNGLNLLPVLPLDGGWIFHTLFFSRHYLLDTLFRMAAVVALLVGSHYGGGKILMYLAILMAIGIPAAYRLAKITDTLRRRGVPPASTDDQTVPTETAQIIISELKQQPVAKVASTKMVAQQALQVFEALNARPPGWLATIGLVFAYGASLGLAVVFTGVFLLGQRGGFYEGLGASAAKPRYPLEVGTFAEWRGTEVAKVAQEPPVTIIATFPGRQRAAQSLADLTNRLPQNTSVRAFGQSLLVSLPSGAEDLRREWFAELQGQTKLTFIERTNFPAKLWLSCNAPNETVAAEIESQLEGYFNTLPPLFLIPPWLPSLSGESALRPEHQLARKTYVQIQKNRYASLSNGSEEGYSKRISAARQQGDQEEVSRLRKEMKASMEAEQQKRLQAIRNGSHGPVDTNIVDLYQTLTLLESNPETDHSPTLQLLAERLGQLPLENGNVAPTQNAFGTVFGAVERKGAALNLTWLSFTSVSDGAPALVQWLAAQGCADFKYAFSASLLDAEADEN